MRNTNQTTSTLNNGLKRVNYARLTWPNKEGYSKYEVEAAQNVILKESREDECFAKVVTPEETYLVYPKEKGRDAAVYIFRLSKDFYNLDITTEEARIIQRVKTNMYPLIEQDIINKIIDQLQTTYPHLPEYILDILEIDKELLFRLLKYEVTSFSDHYENKEVTRDQLINLTVKEYLKKSEIHEELLSKLVTPQPDINQEIPDSELGNIIDKLEDLESVCSLEYPQIAIFKGLIIQERDKRILEEVGKRG